MVREYGEGEGVLICWVDCIYLAEVISLCIYCLLLYLDENMIKSSGGRHKP